MNEHYSTSIGPSQLMAFFPANDWDKGAHGEGFREVLYLRIEYQHIMSTPETSYSRPLLIYDDRCSSCRQFALWARRLSGGWIRLAGHYYSPEASEVKKSIFPDDYDPTQMFWLINKKGAFGARSGLIEVFKEIIRGLIKTKMGDHFPNNREECTSTEGEDITLFNNNSCNRLTGLGCASFHDTWIRIFGMLRSSDKYHHHTV